MPTLNVRSIVIAALLPLAACGNSPTAGDSPGAPASGSGSSRDFAVQGFTSINLAGSDDVDVRVGPAFSVRATGDPKVLDRLKIERDGAALKIGRRSGMSWSDGSARVTVTMPAIDGAGIGGSGNLTVDRVRADRFRGSIAGSGNLTLAQVAAGAVDLSIAGSGDVKAAGTARALGVKIAGSGNVDAAGLTAASADVNVVGSGNVTARVTGAATVNAMGSGDVDLGPAARCTTRKMGSGEVRCGR